MTIRQEKLLETFIRKEVRMSLNENILPPKSSESIVYFLEKIEDDIKLCKEKLKDGSFTKPKVEFIIKRMKINTQSIESELNK